MLIEKSMGIRNDGFDYTYNRVPFIFSTYIDKERYTTIFFFFYELPS